MRRTFSPQYFILKMSTQTSCMGHAMGIVSSLLWQAAFLIGGWQQQASFCHLDFQDTGEKESKTELLPTAAGFEGLYHSGRVCLPKAPQKPKSKGILHMTDCLYSTGWGGVEGTGYNTEVPVKWAR